MAKVKTSDIKVLFKEAVRKFEEERQTKLAESKKPTFFIEFTEYINTKTGFSLKNDTIYKQYYIRLKSCRYDKVGCSWDYLNAFSNFVHGKPYYEAYETEDDDNITEVKVVGQEELKWLENHPEIPEYPAEHPAFPATPHYPVKIPNFKDVWVKDESYNPGTGTHKDRMAWEVYLFYQREIEKRLKRKRLRLYPLSIISSGNAALAIQHLFKSRGLPNLKVILDNNLNESLKKAIKNSGCQPYYVDLDYRELSAEDILDITENANGIQLNFTDGIEKLKLNYYDWLSYEILNLNPDYVFVPFGSGELYKNILAINTKEIRAKEVSKRYFGDKERLSKCHFFGATTFHKDSSLKMLYARYNNAISQNIEQFIAEQSCGVKSKVIEVEETYVAKASKLADQHSIRHEPSGIAGLALLLQMQEGINPSKKILIVNTGKLKIEQFG